MRKIGGGRELIQRSLQVAVEVEIHPPKDGQKGRRLGSDIGNRITDAAKLPGGRVRRQKSVEFMGDTQAGQFDLRREQRRIEFGGLDEMLHPSLGEMCLAAPLVMAAQEDLMRIGAVMGFP